MLYDKLRQFEEVLGVKYKGDKKLLFFSVETEKINDEVFANKLIKLIDHFTFLFFFKNLKIYLNQIGVQSICFFRVIFHLAAFNLYSLLSSKTFLSIKFVLALSVLTTGGIFPVSFGYFFGLCRCLWIVCRFIENDDNND